MSATRSQRLGGTPQEIRLPLPRGTTAIPSAAASRITPAASLTVPGKAT